MKMTKTLNGGNMTIALEGRLDTMTAPELETANPSEAQKA